MSININNGYFYYSVSFCGVVWETETEMYLNADTIQEAIEEMFDGDLVEQDLASISVLEISNFLA